MAYGGPDGIEDIEPYYTDIRRGSKPSPEALAELVERYQAIGGASPLLAVTRRQAGALQRALGEDVPVFVGMRHWKPFIAATVQEMAAGGVQAAVGIIMSPYYSRLSVGAYADACNRALSETQGELRVDIVESWYDHPQYLRAWEDLIDSSLRQFPEHERNDVVVVFTAHSLPERILAWNDPYPQQLLETSRRLADALGVQNRRFAFQSAGRTNEPWLGPDLGSMLKTLQEEGVRSVLVCPVGFIADHLEVLYDIDIEARAEAEALGMRLERTPSLNEHPLLIAALADIVRERLS